MEAGDEANDWPRWLQTIEYAMLSTQGAGGIAARPLQTLQVDADGCIWFFTSAASAKIDEIRRDDRVGLSYADVARKRFVQVSGRAEILVDAAKVGELWSEAQRIFFPQGRDDPSLVLLRVVPLAVHFWDGNESPLGLAAKYGRALLLRERSDLGTRADVDLEGRPAPTR